MEVVAETLEELPGLYLIDQSGHVAFKLTDVGEPTVDAAFHEALHAMAGVEQRLLAYVLTELTEHRLLYMGEHFIFFLSAGGGDGLYHLLKHEYILYFRHVGHKYFLVTQIFHLLRVAAVAVDDAVAVKMVEGIKVVEGACSLDDLVATAERPHGVVGEHERI